jgi:hypothetical protein
MSCINSDIVLKVVKFNLQMSHNIHKRTSVFSNFQILTIWREENYYTLVIKNITKNLTSWLNILNIEESYILV